MKTRSILAGLLMISLVAAVEAGTTYQVTCDGGKKTFKVNFGGGRRFERYTAFDPASKKFVYLDWTRGSATPKAAGTIWDHRTGQLIQLYKFPEVETPLPIIPEIKELTICPFTGSKDLKKERLIIYD